MTLSTGTRLGPYEITAPLDAGGMGEVYRARDPRIGREVAIKVLPESFARDRERLRRFEQEARAAGGLNHPALLTIHDIGEQDGVPYIVSELLEGETLRRRLDGGALSPRRAIDYAIQIARGLAAAHDKGIVHRDIKPENIFITQDGRAKILDFGLAKIDAPSAADKTEPGQVMGTAAYMSPEQVRGEAVDARSDIFAFGALLYEMLTGSRAFDGPSRVETMHAILSGEAREVVNAPPALSRIISKCLEKHPRARFQAAADLAFDLEQISEFSDIGRTRPLVRRALWPAIGALLLLGLVAIAILRKPVQHAATATQIQSIAVLPFENATGRRDLEYLSDGFSEELIDKLCEVPGLRVIARTTAFRFKNKPLDLHKIAEDLEVDAVVVGKLSIRGDRASLQTDLVDVKGGAELWGRRYEYAASDLVRIQDRLAEDVRVRLRGSGFAIAMKPATPSGPAYDEYLRGRYEFDLRTYDSLSSAAGHFQKAIDIDHHFALAYAGLASTYQLLAANQTSADAEQLTKKASDAIDKALELVPDLAEAHAARGVMEQARWNLRASDEELRRAIAVSPNLALAHHWLSNNYRGRGDYANAIRENQIARRIDPLSPALWTTAAANLYDSGDSEAALAATAEALAITPDFSVACFLNGAIAADQHDFAQAEAWFKRSLKKPTIAFAGEAALANLYGRTGRPNEAEAIIERLRHSGSRQRVSPMILCYALAGMGRNREALDALERGMYKDGLTFINYRSRALGDLKLDPRYQAIIRRADARFAAEDQR